MSKQKELEKVINRINESEIFFYYYKLNKRNGYYNVDAYDKEGNFTGAINVGNYRETWYFLRGLRCAIWEIKPF